MKSQRLIITSSQRSGEVAPEGLQMALDLGLEVVPRERRSLTALLDAYQADGVMVWREEGPMLHLGGEKFFFHPSMAKARISMLRKGLLNDPMLGAMDLQEGDTVLDCTLGLGADAIVAAYAVGDTGGVTGLEKHPVLAALVAYGLTHYPTDMKSLTAAMKRIQVIHSDHQQYLAGLPDHAYDIVYFDPMFRQPLHTSTGIKPLRLLAEGAALETAAVRQALRVAAKRVVIKERKGSPEFQRLGCDRVEGGPSSPVAYGIIECP